MFKGRGHSLKRCRGKERGWGDQGELRKKSKIIFWSVKKCNHTIERRISGRVAPLKGKKKCNHTIKGMISRRMGTILEHEKVQPHH